MGSAYEVKHGNTGFHSGERFRMTSMTSSPDKGCNRASYYVLLMRCTLDSQILLLLQPPYHFSCRNGGRRMPLTGMFSLAYALLPRPQPEGSTIVPGHSLDDSRLDYGRNEYRRTFRTAPAFGGLFIRAWHTLHHLRGTRVGNIAFRRQGERLRRRSHTGFRGGPSPSGRLIREPIAAPAISCLPDGR